MLLERFVSRVNARLLLQRAMDEVGDPAVRPTDAQLSRVSARLRTGMALFIHEDHRREAMRLVAEACGESPTMVGPTRIVIAKEADVSLARAQARRQIESLGASAFTAQKVTTIVSELARNIVSYTDGGAIDIDPRAPLRRVFVTATDTGGGITNIDSVLAGTYRSRTGLGRGILGCKNLADRFEIETNAHGTRIRVEVRI